VFKLSTHSEGHRAYEYDPELLQDYFGNLGWWIRHYDLRESQICNMDGNYFLIGLPTRAKVLCRRGRRNPRDTHDGKHQLLTVIETVAGDGCVLSPFIINKGVEHYMGWYKSFSEGETAYLFSYSLKGWTDDQLALGWLQKVLLRETEAKSPNLPRLLIFDDHGSHITFKCISQCFSNYVLLP